MLLALRDRPQQVTVQNAHLRQQSEQPNNSISQNPQYNNSILEGDTSYFHDDMASARQDITFTAASRTKILATEIGECTMAIDLAALMSQKRNLETVNTTENRPQVNLKRQKNSKDAQSFLEKKLSMRTLVFNLFAAIFSERSAEELTQMTLPTNALYIFMSSTLAQEKEGALT